MHNIKLLEGKNKSRVRGKDGWTDAVSADCTERLSHQNLEQGVPGRRASAKALR